MANAGNTPQDDFKDKGEWSERKIQKHGKGYYRVGLPKEFIGDEEIENLQCRYNDHFLLFAKHLDDIDYTKTGKYTVIKQPGDERRAKLDFSLDFLDNTEMTKQLLKHLVDSYCTPGIGDSFTELGAQTPEEISNVIQGAQVTEYVEWDDEQNSFKFMDDITIEQYTSLIAEYITQFASLLSDENVKHRVRDYKIMLQNQKTEINKKWVLVTRSTMKTFFSLDRPNFSNSFAKLYISRNLKVLTDKISEIAELLIELQGESPQLFDSLRSELEAVFSDFGTQIKENALNSSSKSPSNKVIKDTVGQVNTMLDRLNESVENIEVDNDNNTLEQGIHVGRIISKSRDAIKLSHSIALVGLGARYITESIVYEDEVEVTVPSMI